MRHIASIGTLTIASGQTASNVLDISRISETMIDVVIYTPAALTGTVTLYLGYANGTAAHACNIGGSAVTLAAASAVPVPVAAFKAIKVVSGSAEGADRVFRILAQCDVAA